MFAGDRQSITNMRSWHHQGQYLQENPARRYRDRPDGGPHPETSGQTHQVIDFYPYGYDERQFCSPGFNLAVGCLMRSQHGQFPEYHTSADNLDFVRPQYLAQSYATCLSVVEALEHNKTYATRNPKCEPQLGKRGLYKAIGGHKDAGTRQMAILWVLNLSDGQHSLLDIAERSGIAFQVLKETADALLAHELLEELSLIHI